MASYLSPFWAVSLGDLRLQLLRQFEVTSSRVSPMDVATIEAPRAGFPLASMTKGLAVTVRQGYRETGSWLIFQGFLWDVREGKTTVILDCRDAMQRLEDVRLNQTFLRATPQEILTYALRAAGVTDYRLSSRALPARRFVPSGEPLPALIKRLNQTWGLTDWGFYFTPEGQFWWGPWAESPRYLEQQELPVLAYGENILRHDVRRDRGYGTLETFAVPWVRHSHRLRLRDPRYGLANEVVRVERIRYQHGERRARTVIEWSRVTS